MPLLQTSGNVTADGYGGGVAAVPNYIEDVFSTYLYTGTGANQTITNSIDLSTKGGMVWIKDRKNVQYNHLFDTSRGTNTAIFSNDTFGNTTVANSLTAFNTTGFNLGTSANVNGTIASYVNAPEYVSWTFRKQPKFFDVVTYTGDGTTQNIAHSLGSVPGMVIIKATSGANAGAQNWPVWHRGLTSGNYILLDSTNEQTTASAAVRFGNNTTTVDPTSTVFTVGSSNAVNASGWTYVAYLFAHDAGGFGLTGTDNVISCGSFTTGASGITTVDLGYEPQYLLFKTSSTTGSWVDLDTMRGFSMTQNNILSPDTSAAEDAWGDGYVKPTATGFTADSSWIGTSRTFIYIAIRRGPMKVPTSGTSVYKTVLSNPTNSGTSVTGAGFPPDLNLALFRQGSSFAQISFDRLRGGSQYLSTSLTSAEGSVPSDSFLQDGFLWGSASGESLANTFMRRAPSFFDEVCYTGTGATTAFAHNLGVAPELAIYKVRNGSSGWVVYAAPQGISKYAVLNSTVEFATDPGGVLFGGVSPTSTQFTIGSAYCASGSTYVAYFFASCPGVSKVGSYTGTGATQTIACGFAGGARFVMIKRTDVVADWYVWDTARGMLSGTDPWLQLNTTNAEFNTNSVYTTTGGFQIVSTAAGINASGGTYIFLAIA